MKLTHYQSQQTAGVERTITLAKKTKQLYNYYKSILNQFAPNTIVMIHYLSHSILTVEHTDGYMKNDAPKALTEIAIQKMIRLEVARANLRKGISGQHFRNTYILNLIKKKLLNQKL